MDLTEPVNENSTHPLIYCGLVDHVGRFNRHGGLVFPVVGIYLLDVGGDSELIILIRSIDVVWLGIVLVLGHITTHMCRLNGEGTGGTARRSNASEISKSRFNVVKGVAIGTYMSE